MLVALRTDEAGNEPAEALDRLAHTCWHIYPMPGTAGGYQFLASMPSRPPTTY